MPLSLEWALKTHNLGLDTIHGCAEAIGHELPQLNIAALRLHTKLPYGASIGVTKSLI